MSSSDVKKRIVARVTGIPFIPAKTVEIGENQVVVDLAPNPVLQSEAFFQRFATGGIVENAPVSFVGEQPSDYVLPKALTDQLMTQTEKELQSAESDIEIRDGDFLLNFTEALRTELDAVLDPDTRVLHFGPPLPSIAVAGTPFVGKPDSSEVTDDNEQLTEHRHRITDGLAPLDLKWAVQSVQPNDYEQAAELGMSVHAYRYIVREIATVEGHIELAKRQAVSDAVESVRAGMIRAATTVNK